MRGKLACNTETGDDGGITPAHAGKTFAGTDVARALGDHPRACGENRTALLKMHRHSGSPPRMRGKPVIQCKCALSSGITPAHAGKTHTAHHAKTVFGDHPRACGENMTGSYRRLRKKGSPPRMRGKPLEVLVVLHSEGITPAHAGKT